MTTSESKGRFFYKTNRFESIRITNRTESIRIANWNALVATCKFLQWTLQYFTYFMLMKPVVGVVDELLMFYGENSFRLFCTIICILLDFVRANRFWW